MPAQGCPLWLEVAVHVLSSFKLKPPAAHRCSLRIALPYHESVLRLPSHANYMLPSILGRVLLTPGKADSMRAVLSCVWRYFVWQQPEGRALEALMCSLRRKLTFGRLIATLFLDTCRLGCELPDGQQLL